MRPYYLLILIVLSSLISQSQNVFIDVIYPLHGNDSIPNCHIIKIKMGNLIIYELENKQDTVEAIAIVKTGQFIDFRTREEIQNNSFPILNPIITKTDHIKPEIKDYDYYNIQYLKALGQKRAGLTFTLLGAGCVIISINILANSNSAVSSTAQLGTILFTTGTVAFHLGLPYLISGSVKAKNNKKAMLKHKQKEASLNIGLTNNGIGFIIKF